MELQAGKPQKKGNHRGPAFAYNVKTLRDQEMRIAEQAERNYARFVDRWKTRPDKNGCASASIWQGPTELTRRLR
jgi:transposase